MFRLIIPILLIWITPICKAQGPPDTNYDEAKVPDYRLPELLMDSGGNSVNVEQWESHRRGEIQELFETYVYGKTPNRTMAVRYQVVELDENALEGLATRKQVAIFLGESEYRLDLLIHIPNEIEAPAPCFLGLNFKGNHTVDEASQILRTNERNKRGSSSSRWPLKTIIKRGYSIATLNRDQIDPDNYNNDFTDGIHPLFYKTGQTKPAADEWGSIGAWAWGLSRALDYLETDSKIDNERVAVFGHSRLGKTALWAGAQDSRFAMVISNNSGCGGAALYRRCYGERLHHMLRSIGYWFCENHHEFAKREDELPVDQHMLLALIAPRPLYIASATNDRWADPKGEFLAAKNASSVYDLFGQPSLSNETFPLPDSPIHSKIGYHLREGKHDITIFDWQQYLAFADKYLN